MDSAVEDFQLMLRNAVKAEVWAITRQDAGFWGRKYSAYAAICPGSFGRLHRKLFSC